MDRVTDELCERAAHRQTMVVTADQLETLLRADRARLGELGHAWFRQTVEEPPWTERSNAAERLLVAAIGLPALLLTMLMIAL